MITSRSMLLVLAILAGYSASSDSVAEHLLQEGVRLAKGEHDLGLAANHLRAAIQHSALDEETHKAIKASALNALGNISFLKGENDQALLYISESLHLQPLNAITLRNRAWLLQASPHKLNHEKPFMEGTYSLVAEVQLVRMILSLRNSSRIITYEVLLFSVLKHFNIATIARTAEAGARSIVTTPTLLRKYQFEIEITHLGDGSVTLDVIDQACHTTPCPTMTELSQELETTTLNIFEVGLGGRLCTDPFHLLPKTDALAKMRAMYLFDMKTSLG